MRENIQKGYIRIADIPTLSEMANTNEVKNGIC